MSRIVLPDEIVAEAREWVNTRWQHQAALKGVGCDCAGLIIGVGIATGAFDAYPHAPEYRRRFGNYSRTPDPRRMTEALDTFMVRVPRYEDAVPGDVVYLRFDETEHVVNPQHLAIITAGGWRVGGSVVHAMAAPARAVREHTIDDSWFRRVHKVYRYPAVCRCFDAGDAQ